MNPIAVLQDMLFNVLQFYFSICGNYGVAIILLTVSVKLALYPLTLQSTQQMMAMQKIQPKIEEIKKKFKDNPQKFQSETMDLYKKNKINPIGGCLPMVLQIPFFLALFFALNSDKFKAIVSIHNVNTAFLWIGNLAAPDPTYILVVLIAVTTYYSQKVMSSSSPQMAGMLYFMPLFIAFVSAPFPAGVQLYWVVQNLLTMIQQMYILKKGGLKV